MTLTISPAGTEIIFSGALLFVLGLFQGVLIPKFKNSRMALSAHLTAVQSGTALMVFGAIWTMVMLPSLWLTLTQIALVSSLYLIWAGITLSAGSGASKTLPIAGEGYSGSKFSELLVTVTMGIGVVLSLASGVAIIIGLATSF
jgi:hydroxylaminobenzene mutase